MLNDLRVGLLSAKSSIKNGNKKTIIFIIFVLALIFLNLVFLPSMIAGITGLFTGFMQDYPYGDVVIEPSKDMKYISNSNLILEKVRELPDVKSASKRLDSGISIEYKSKIVGATLTGVIPSEEYSVSRYPYIVKEGEFLGDLAKDEIIIGAMIAGGYFGSEIYDNLGEVKPGSIVNVSFSNGVKKAYKVRGIMQGTFELTDLNALINYEELKEVFSLNNSEATSIVVRVKSAGKEDYLKKEIISTGIKEQVFTWQDKSDVLIKQAMRSINMINVTSKYTSLIIGAALILIIIYINVLNRRKEIGILKAIGISPLSIIFSYAFISLFYVSTGIFLGLIFYAFLMIYFNIYPVVFYETMLIRPQVQLLLVINSLVTMLVMSVLAGILPAWRVSKESILEAIWGK